MRFREIYPKTAENRISTGGGDKSDFRTFIVTKGQRSKELMVDTGFKQENALSLMLFNIALEEVVKKGL